MIDGIINIIGTRTLLIMSALILIINIGLDVTVRSLRTRLDTVNSNNAILSVELEILGEKTVAQNNAVDQLLANAAAQQDRLRVAEKRAGQIQVITEERVQYVERAAIPATCPEAVTWGAEHAVEIGKHWQDEKP